MKITKIEVTTFSIVGKLDSKYSVSFLDKGILVEIPQTTLNRRSLGIGFRNNKVVYSIGCKDVTLDTMKYEYDLFTSPEPVTYTERVVKDKNTKKVVNKSPVIDESDKYYILETKKVYSKEEYYAEEMTFTKKCKLTEKTGYKGGMVYEGHILGDKKYVLEHLSKLIELGVAITAHLQQMKDKPLVKETPVEAQ